jgi:hypothetical protein
MSSCLDASQDYAIAETMEDVLGRGLRPVGKQKPAILRIEMAGNHLSKGRLSVYHRSIFFI